MGALSPEGLWEEPGLQQQVPEPELRCPLLQAWVGEEEEKGPCTQRPRQAARSVEVPSKGKLGPPSLCPAPPPPVPLAAELALGRVAGAQGAAPPSPPL